MKFYLLILLSAWVSSINAGTRDFFSEAYNDSLEMSSGVTMVLSLPTIMSVAYTQSQKHNKLIILKAKSDAVTYIGSNGVIRSAYLESAFRLLKNQYPDTDELELAIAIATY